MRALRTRREVEARAVWGIVACFAIIGYAQTAVAEERDWTAKDSISVRYFVRDQSFPESWDGGSQVAVPSADGKRFFFVFHWGDLKCDCNHYQLSVFSVDQVKAALERGLPGHLPVQPFRVLVLDSITSGLRPGATAISNAHWDTQSDILFINSTANGQDALYRLHVNSGDLERLTDPKTRNGIWDYDLRGGSIAYLAGTPQPIVPQTGIYPFQVLRKDEILDLLSEGRPGQLMEVVTHTGNGGWNTAASYQLPRTSLPNPIKPLLSPNGRWAVAVVPAYEEGGEIGTSRSISSLPEGWQAYSESSLTGQVPQEFYGRLWRYLLIDLTQGKAHAIIDAPKGPQEASPRDDSASVFWSADSRHVLIANVSLPTAGFRKYSRDGGYLVDYEVDSKELSVLDRMINNGETGGVSTKIKEIGWLRSGTELLATRTTTSGKPAPGTSYSLRGNIWIRKQVATRVALPPNIPSKPAQLRDGIRVSIRESSNSPPVIIAASREHEVLLTDPDPTISGVWRSRAIQVTWQEKSGLVAKGILLLPRSGDHTGPAPVVVQLEPSLSDTFRPDGAASTAYAAQALTAQGFAVLEIDATVEKDYPELDGGHWVRGERTDPRYIETKLVVERIDAAIEDLANKGIVDKGRVGLIGFSRKGFYTYYLITHPGRIAPKAAIVADATTESYGEYFGVAATGSGAKEFRTTSTEWQYGGPFWSNKETWLAQAPGFNVDRIETPTLFTYATFRYSTPIPETLAACRITNRECDMMLFPDGGHQMQRPKQRLASLEATVDWMNFWIQDKVDPDPKKSSQYGYWRQLRDHKRARDSAESKLPAKPPTHFIEIDDTTGQPYVPPAAAAAH